MYDRLQVGKVYIFRGGKIKVANQKFNQLSNRYELSFSEATDVREDVDAGDIPQQNVSTEEKRRNKKDRAESTPC